MSSKDGKKPDLDLNSLYSEDSPDEINPLDPQTKMHKNLFESHEELPNSTEVDRLNQEYVFRNFL